MSTFYLQRNLPSHGLKTFVNWAREPVYKAVVFIHGFNGSSLETFGAFNDEFRNRAEYQGRDVYFFGYDSLFDQISNSALNFLYFLRDIHDNLQAMVADSKATLKREQKYTDITIICHSLGAVVTRVALNDGFQSGDHTLINSCRLILFAPAHQGAQKTFSNISFPGYLAALGPIIHYFVVTLDQLLDKAIIIGPMQDKCREIINEHHITSFTVAKKVIWASPERVVINSRFLDDPEAVQYRQKKVSHVKVCKPTRQFTLPLDEVKQVLNESI